MEDIKARLEIVRAITKGRSPMGSEGLDGEVVCLQLRRVLEQIAFGSLLAHRHTYEQAHHDVEKVWSAKRLLDRLAKLHPEFYPRPVRPSPWRPLGVREFAPVKYDILTEEDFIFLYDTASNGIHTWNPFKPGERVLDFRISVAQWIRRIEKLLAMHLIRFAGTNDIWLVQMSHPEDGRVRAFTAPAVAPSEAPSPIATLRKPVQIESEDGLSISILFHT